MKDTADCVYEVPLRDFMLQFSKELPKLIRLLKSTAMREHPRGRQLIPYHVENYGNGVTAGHCVRPDIVLTEDGPIICEIDYVASGRAHLITSLRRMPTAREQVLQGFADWYRAMGVDSVLYGTGTKTSCFLETQIFAEAMQQEVGFDLQAVNLDEYPDLNGRFVDRLTYATEMCSIEDGRVYLRQSTVTTAEPFLDTKATAILVHDPVMQELLIKSLGKVAVKFWQRVMPISFLQKEVDEQAMQIVRTNPRHWVFKSTDVETDTCWGCRGTIVGSAYRAGDLVKYLSTGKKLGRKDTGPNPMVQALGESIDFTELWNRSVSDPNTLADARVFGREVSDLCRNPAQSKVYGRIGFFLPIDTSGKAYTSVSDFAEIVLRQSPIVHGASDAVAVAARLV